MAACGAAVCVWTDEEILKLIEIWGDEAIQAMLEGSRRNKDVFVKISKEMKAAGYSKTAEQCQGKIKKLKHEYKKIKDKHGKTGEGRKNWKFLEPMDSVLGHKPATRPPIVVESSVGPGLGLQFTETFEETGFDTEAEAEDNEEQHSELPLTSKQQGERKKMQADKTNRKRKRESFSRMEELMERIIKVQEESDKHYVKLEEKLLEMEERRERESQDFQFRMMSLLSNQSSDTGIRNTQPYISSSLPTTSSYNFHHAYTFQEDDNY